MGDRLRRLVALLTPVTSTTILVVAVAQRSAVEYIYQWVSFVHEPWLLFESTVTHLKTLVQNMS
jgi:hypothetical protein